jgi:hypothetical protein
MGEANHSWGGRPSETAVGAAEEAGAARGTAVGAARGRNPGWTARAGRGATSGSNLGGTFEAGWQGATIPAVVSQVSTVETVEADSQKKSRLVGLGEATKGKLSLTKPHVERRSGSLWRDQGSGSLCDQRSSQGRNTG